MIDRGVAGGHEIVETAEQTSQNGQAPSPVAPAPPEDGEPVWVEPDLDFIRALRRQGGDSLKKCFQCGTCSSACGLSPDRGAFPRKEMAWATWGAKRRLLEDPHERAVQSPEKRPVQVTQVVARDVAAVTRELETATGAPAPFLSLLDRVEPAPRPEGEPLELRQETRVEQIVAVAHGALPTARSR